MERMDWILKQLSRLDPRLVARLERWLQRIPAVQQQIEHEYDTLLDGLEDEVKPYRHQVPVFAQLPAEGLGRPAVLQQMAALQEQERARWQDGFVSGAVYHGDREHIDFLNQVYALYSQANPLHADIWPSITKFEAEIVAMTAQMLSASMAQQHDGSQVCGTVTSGGTESILLAMKTYRDWARETRHIKHPEMVIPITAHAAFDKAAQYFNIKAVRIPVGSDYRAVVAEARKAISRRTVVIVGSAPSFPHGMIDPIEELSELARQHKIAFHTDACLGGFLLPFAEKLGYPVPPFDFRLPGVTSISADTHKYGYAAKGTSVVLYRSPELRRYQYYATSDWPGGLYFSPTFAGSRPGALSAACWAAMVATGEHGYRQAAAKILETADWIKAQLKDIPELHLLGDPLFVLAFGSDEVDIYQVLDRMTQRGWSLNGLHKPSCVHLCITLRHTEPGVKERFINDLKQSILEVKNNPEAESGMAPVYGMAATLPLRGVVSEMLKRYIDILYKV